MLGAAAFVLRTPVSAVAEEGDEAAAAAAAGAEAVRAVAECTGCVDSYCVGAGAHAHVTLPTRRKMSSSVAASLATDMANRK